MTVTKIDVPDYHDSMSKVTIDGTVYHLRFTYNSFGDYWSMGIYDENQREIIPMTRIVPMYDLFRSYKYASIPQGNFVCVSKTEEVGEPAFKNEDAIIIYLGVDE